MFRQVKLCLLVVVIGVLTGCQPVDSFSPLYRDKDVIFDPALLGQWKEKDATLEFFKAADNAYDVVFSDDVTPSEHMELEGHLMNLEGQKFLDLVPKKWSAKPDSYQFSMEQGKNGSTLMPSLVHAGDGAYLEFRPAKAPRMEVQLRMAHWFFRVTKDDRRLNLDYVDDDKLTKSLERKTVQIEHILVGPRRKSGEKEDRQLVLTATTAALQKLVLAHANDDQFFSDSLKFQRLEKSNPTSSADQH